MQCMKDGGKKMSKNIRRILAVAMTVAMAIGMCACGGGGGGKTPANVKGKTFDTGAFSVLVPDGWMKNDVSFNGDVDTSQLQIFKGATDSLDMWSSPSVVITYCKDRETAGTAMSYAETSNADTAKQLDPVKTGDYTWDAASVETDYGNYIILTADEPEKFYIILEPEVDDKSFSIEDADVQAILSSLKGTAE